MDISSYISFLQADGAYYSIKILLLVLMAVYAIITFITFARVRALNRTIYLAAAHASAILQILSFLSFLISVSLFIITLVIV